MCAPAIVTPITHFFQLIIEKLVEILDYVYTYICGGHIHTKKNERKLTRQRTRHVNVSSRRILSIDVHTYFGILIMYGGCHVSLHFG